MEHNHKLGLYISYYLARFNEIAYQNLGFGNQKETHKRIGDLLGVKPQTVQNWRDEFDPLFGHRAGWYQRPMNPSRVQVVQALADMDEPQIFEIVRDILSDNSNFENDDFEPLIRILAANDKKSNIKFVLRTSTGRAAEEFFINYFSENRIPANGKLIDCRDLGVGYDFRIEGEKQNCYIEVKGLTDYSGGIIFTSKEWMVAKSKGENYFLCIVSNISVKAEIIFIQDPAAKLNPKKNIYTSIQINWSVSEKQLADLK
jgi:hypothetical protein